MCQFHWMGHAASTNFDVQLLQALKAEHGEQDVQLLHEQLYN